MTLYEFGKQAAMPGPVPGAAMARSQLSVPQRMQQFQSLFTNDPNLFRSPRAAPAAPRPQPQAAGGSGGLLQNAGTLASAGGSLASLALPFTRYAPWAGPVGAVAAGLAPPTPERWRKPTGGQNAGGLAMLGMAPFTGGSSLLPNAAINARQWMDKGMPSMPQLQQRSQQFNLAPNVENSPLTHLGNVGRMAGEMANYPLDYTVAPFYHATKPMASAALNDLGGRFSRFGESLGRLLSGGDALY